MENNNFIGIGKNPGGPDLPLGLGMKLAQDPQAMTAFGGMTNTQKTSLISYLQSCETGEEAESRMSDTVERLHNNQISF